MLQRLIPTAGPATLLGLLLLGMPATARAEAPQSTASTLSRWPVDIEHPENGIPSEKDRDADPLQFGYWLQDVALKAEHASKDGDHVVAARLYAALARAVPDRAVGAVKACEEYEAAGSLQKAIDACGDALLRDGARVSDYSHFVGLMLAKPGRLSDKDTAALGAVLAHMKTDPAGRDAVADLECQVGTRTSNIALLEECTKELATRAPDDAKTLTYRWALAVADRRFDDARELGERARTAGVPAENVAAMDRLLATNETHRRWERALSVLVGGLILALLGLFGRDRLRRRPQMLRATASARARSIP
jgi:hypothetical protein